MAPPVPPSICLLVLTLGLAWAQPQQEAAQKLSRANALVQAGKPEAAIPLFRELVAAFPAEPSLGVNLAVAQFKAGLFRDAITECRRVLRLRPGLFPALLFLGASHLQLGEADSAIAPLREAVRLNPGDVNARLALADSLLAVGQFAEASEHFSPAAEAIPENPRVWHGLYRCYVAMEADLLSEMRKNMLETTQFDALLGDFEHDRGQFAHAFELFRGVLTRQPGFRGLHAKVAEIYSLTGHAGWAEAERAREVGTPCTADSAECDFAAGRLEQAVRAGGGSAEALYWRGQALRALRQRAFARLQGLGPSRERFEAAAEAFERSANYREAAGAWKQSLALAPADGELKRRLALALCHSNDCASALPLLRGLVAAKPASAELNYLCGLALNSLREPAQALPFLEAAVRLDGQFAPARGALGEALLEAGRTEQAIPHLEVALANDDDGVRHYQLARALQATGKRERAAEVLKQYRAILNRRTAAENAAPRITAP